VLRHPCCDGIQVAGSLLRRYSRPEPANQSKVAVGAPVEIIPAGDLLRIDGGDPVVGPEEVAGAVKVPRRDTDDGEGILVEQNGAADDAWIGGESPLPIVVGENDVRSGAAAVLIRGVEEAAKHGLQAEQVKVIAGSGVAQGFRNRLIDGDTDTDRFPNRHAGEGAVAIAKIEVIGPGLLEIAIVSLPDLKEILWMGHINGTQEHAVEHAEDNDVGADADGQCKDGDEGEAGRMAQLAEGEADIGEDAFGARPHPGFVSGLFDTGYVAELTFGRVLGVFAAHPAGDEGFDFFGEVLLDLLGEIAVDLSAMEELSQPMHGGRP
jgi:hypothetical protein